MEGVDRYVGRLSVDIGRHIGSFSFSGQPSTDASYIEVARSVIYWEIGFSRVEVGFSTYLCLIHRCSVAQKIKMIRYIYRPSIGGLSIEYRSLISIEYRSTVDQAPIVLRSSIGRSVADSRSFRHRRITNISLTFHRHSADTSVDRDQYKNQGSAVLSVSEIIRIKTSFHPCHSAKSSLWSRSGH